MRRLVRRLRWFWLDVRMGICSGFPLCCVTFFLLAWNHGDMAAPWRKKYRRRLRGTGYICCPLCLLSGARVRVKTCTSRCGHVEEANDIGYR